MQRPYILLAGDPYEIQKRMPLGVAGIVTNPAVLRQMTEKYGPLREVVKRYCDVTDKPVFIEVDGDTTDEVLRYAYAVREVSDQVALKLPVSGMFLPAIAELAKAGVTVMATCLFTVNQAAVAVGAGAKHIAPFLAAHRDMGGDPGKLVRDIAALIQGHPNRPLLSCALVRSAEMAQIAFQNGADGVIVFTDVFDQMMENLGTADWVDRFGKEWKQIEAAGNLESLRTARV